MLQKVNFLTRQEILFVNLIRKVLLKDFKSCDSAADVNSAYDDKRSIHTRSCICDDSSQLPPNCILSSILKTQLLVKKNFSKLETLDKLDDPINCDMEIQTTLQDYKIGSTALDCSIMITLRRIKGNFDVRYELKNQKSLLISEIFLSSTNSENIIDKNHHVAIASSGTPQNFIVNSTIVDLDLKKDSIAHFRKYKKQYWESKLAYFDFMENRKIKFHD